MIIKNRGNIVAENGRVSLSAIEEKNGAYGEYAESERYGEYGEYEGYETYEGYEEKYNYNIEDMLNNSVKIAERLSQCSVTIEYGGKLYGNNSNAQIWDMVENFKVMSPFKWRGCLGYRVTDGLIVFWKQNSILRKNGRILESIARQIDLTIKNYKLTLELKEMATIDELTKLYNRRYFMNEFNSVLDYNNRYKKEHENKSKMGFLILDIDKFKSYNDTFGHPEGDILLNNLGKILKRTIRKTDIVGRLGGEEFGLILHEIKNKEQLKELGDKLRVTIAEELTVVKGTSKRDITVSVGGSIQREDGETLEEIYRKADERLYKAKESGRNRVVV